MKKRRLVFIILFLSILLGACGNGPGYAEKVRDIDFTVVEEAELPEDLKKAIEERKEQGFKLTYAKGEDLYIVVGYGKKETGGYSIQVKNLYLTPNAIYFDTELLGPEGDDVMEQEATYPFIAVKTEFMDYSVVFD